MHICPRPNTRQLSRICRELSIANADLGINDDPLVPRFANWQQSNYASGSDKKAAISGSSFPKNRVSKSRANCQNSSSPSQSTSSHIAATCLKYKHVCFVVSLSVTRLLVLSHPSRRSSSRKGHGLSSSHGSTRHVLLRRLRNAKLACTSCSPCWKPSSKGSRTALKTSSNCSRFSLSIPKAWKYE